MQALSLTLEMQIVMGILALTMFLFITEWVRVDVTAVLIMVTLGVLSYYWPLIIGQANAEFVPVELLFSGFASNAVMSIIAVMIIGAGLDKSGIMTQLANRMLKISGTTEKRIIPLVSGVVAFISSFMQNIGAAALFLPVVNRISNSSGIPMSRLLMPMGFCAILGGTITMIGSSPLILLNDLLLTSNKNLPEGVEQMETFGLFDVSPIGLVLVFAGILYFVVAGRFVLPKTKKAATEDGAHVLNTLYNLDGQEFEVTVSNNSHLVGMTIDEIEELSLNTVRVIAANQEHHNSVSPSHEMVIQGGNILVLLGIESQVTHFSQAQGLTVSPKLMRFADTLTQSQVGIAEIIVPPSSQLVGHSLRDLRLRKTHGLNVLTVFRGTKTIQVEAGLRDLILQAGDTLVVHTTWTDLAECSKQDRDFTIVTTNYPNESMRPDKLWYALGFFGLALSLVLFTDMKLSLALFVGALGMIISGVLTIDEAYQKVGWQSVFLLASLIPLGLAVENTNTAAWIAQQVLTILDGVPIWVLQSAVAILATIFTLLMSNVGATVLLVPLAINIAIGAGADPRVFALTVAIATSNSFLIPTHQVNALIMGPGGYSVKDFIKAGSIMTVLFLVISITMLNVIF